MDSTFASVQPSTQPNAIPSAHHRKIELQSYADLTYLQQNLAKAARGKLDLHFPPISNSSKPAAPATVISLDGPLSQSQPNPITDTNNNDDNSTSKQTAITTGDDTEEDPLRARVRQLIDTFLAEMHSAARHSISINGIEASSLPLQSHIPNCSNPELSTKDGGQDSHNTSQETETEIEGVHYTHEPFDPRLQKKLAALHGELESLTAQVSKLRRDAPRQSATAYSQALEAQIQKDDEEWEAELRRIQSEKEKYPGLDVQVIREGWNQDVKGTFERGVAQLAVLSGVAGTQTQSQTQTRTQDRDQKQHDWGIAEDSVSLTETMGRAQRARDVAMEFE